MQSGLGYRQFQKIVPYNLQGPLGVRLGQPYIGVMRPMIQKPRSRMYGRVVPRGFVYEGVNMMACTLLNFRTSVPSKIGRFWSVGRQTRTDFTVPSPN
jgi:hypothetical protein